MASIFILIFFLCRRRVVQIYKRGARILEGYFMTQDLSFGASNSESGSSSESATVLSVAIVDPYVLLRMSDGGIRLLVGGILVKHSNLCLSYANDFECSYATHILVSLVGVAM